MIAGRHVGVMTQQDIKSKAKALLQNCGLYRLPVDVDALASRIDLHVNYTNLDDDYSGLLVIRGGAAIAHINKLHHPNRQRFSLAHEIGHFVLHEQQQTSGESAYVDKVMRLYHRADREFGQDARMEWQANVFASEILMPEQLLRSKILDEGYDLEDEADVSRLAVVLKVSEQALAIRLTRMKDLLEQILDVTAFDKPFD